MFLHSLIGMRNAHFLFSLRTFYVFPLALSESLHEALANVKLVSGKCKAIIFNYFIPLYNAKYITNLLQLYIVQNLCDLTKKKRKALPLVVH